MGNPPTAQLAMMFIGVLFVYLLSAASLLGALAVGGAALLQDDVNVAQAEKKKPIISPKIAVFLARKNEPWPKESEPEKQRPPIASVAAVEAPNIIVRTLPDPRVRHAKKNRVPRDVAIAGSPFHQDLAGPKPWLSYREERNSDF